jgi:hypothetical protein
MKRKREPLFPFDAQDRLRARLKKLKFDAEAIERCFPPFGRAWWLEEPEIPDQIAVMQEGLREQGRRDHDENDALVELLGSDLGLEPETRAYIVRKYLNQYINFPTMINRYQERREFAKAIRRIKKLLQKPGSGRHSAGQAEAAIATDLGITIPALSKRLQRCRPF